MNLNQAQKIANELVEILRPHSKIINIAGSIRRGKPEVKDIEIVCAPKTVKQLTFFGDGKCYNSEDFKAAVKKIPGTIVHGSAGGRNARIALESGITLDLFMPQKHDYYRQYATRTGSGKYSHKVLALTWVRIGWVGTRDGLRRRSESSEYSNGWKCYKADPTLPPVWPSEEEFFEWLGLKWINPSDRNV